MRRRVRPWYLGYRGGLGVVNAYSIDAYGICVYGIGVYDGGDGGVVIEIFCA